ncbi:hypothetical protein DICPUDRAFT_46021 [Dictyostelium purpureum]|uniref:EGF-like domain-containing protein n=1 Tax=Dictyostelium purpureum TaxID=5786 RepID=F0ZD52_DICPU|nr:uncharacterized protein DICPUDRAFT_46021 [Dictyostelium purpureum]EGC38143.1 hypothetical protein DICPUDRAFT_46021 [Dictyostelium purpureum]|eukprot:XP_003285357.1 hypothetical protein DICPUDRAFT_46021 [Dictyostelium purpureum]
MKIFKSLITLISIVGVALSCDQDYECSTGFPINACQGDLNIYRGIGIDGNGNVLIAGIYNSSGGGPFGFPGIFSIPTNSDNDNTITKKFDVYGEIADGPGYTALDYFYTYLPQSDSYYVRFNQRGAPLFSIYNPSTKTIQPVWNIFNTPFVPAFDEANNRFVYGWYGISMINKLPTQRDDVNSATLIYQRQIVNGLVLDGTDIYMTTYDGRFLKGTTNCNNCTQDELQLLLNDTDTSTLMGLVMAGDYLYFSYAGGIKGYPKSGDASRVRQLVSDSDIVSIVASKDGNFIYYTTESGVVKSVSTQGNHAQVKVLYTSQSNHQCMTAPGFESDSTCKGMVLWSNGLPYCTPVTNGKPNICFAAYQCGGSPTQICNGQCTCLPNFYDDNCMSCDGTVEWSGGYPNCKL